MGVPVDRNGVTRRRPVRTYATRPCRRGPTRRPFPGLESTRAADPVNGRLTGKREWETVYHGQGLADIVTTSRYVRDEPREDHRPAQPNMD